MKVKVPERIDLVDCDACAAIQLGKALFLIAEEIGQRHAVTPLLMQQALLEAAAAWACCAADADDEPIDVQGTVTAFERALRYAAALADGAEPEHRH